MVDKQFKQPLFIFQTFHSKCSSVLGEEFLVHNVHLLLHLPSQCRSFGSLDNFSAYKFENCLGKIKKKVRAGNNPLQQIISRMTATEEKPALSQARKYSSHRSVWHNGVLLRQGFPILFLSHQLSACFKF